MPSAGEGVPPGGGRGAMEGGRGATGASAVTTRRQSAEGRRGTPHASSGTVGAAAAGGEDAHWTADKWSPGCDGPCDGSVTAL